MILKRLRWLFLGLTIACLIAARLHVSLAPKLAAIFATLALAVAFAAISNDRGRRWQAWGTLLVGVGVSIAVALGHLQVFPLLLSSVLVPLALAGTFGRTLRRGRTPLIHRMALIVHGVPELNSKLVRYTRNATLAWTALFASLTLGNGWLMLNATPGGLADIAGLPAPSPLLLAECVRLSSLVTFGSIAGLFLVEFCLRFVLLTDDPFRDPILFARQVRNRWPAIAASLRGDE